MSTKACIVATLASSLVEISKPQVEDRLAETYPSPRYSPIASGLTQPIRVEQELGNVLGLFARDETSLHKELYTLLQDMSRKNSQRTTSLTFFGF